MLNRAFYWSIGFPSLVSFSLGIVSLYGISRQEASTIDGISRGLGLYSPVTFSISAIVSATFVSLWCRWMMLFVPSNAYCQRVAKYFLLCIFVILFFYSLGISAAVLLHSFYFYFVRCDLIYVRFALWQCITFLLSVFGGYVLACPCPSTVRSAKNDDGEAETGENTEKNTEKPDANSK